MKSIAIHRPNNRLGSIQTSIRNFYDNFVAQFKSLVAPRKFWTKSIKIGDFDRSKINIEIDGRILIVTAQNSSSVIDFWESGCTSTEQKIAFRRTFGLPFNADKSKVKTSVKSGVLNIKVMYPK